MENKTITGTEILEITNEYVNEFKQINEMKGTLKTKINDYFPPILIELYRQSTDKDVKLLTSIKNILKNKKVDLIKNIEIEHNKELNFITLTFISNDDNSIIAKVKRELKTKIHYAIKEDMTDIILELYHQEIVNLFDLIENVMTEKLNLLKENQTFKILTDTNLEQILTIEEDYKVSIKDFLGNTLPNDYLDETTYLKTNLINELISKSKTKRLS